MSILALNKVNYSYKNGKKILSDISMEFEKKKFYAILGTSGSGKTTLSKLLLHLYQAESGNILINDNNIEDIQIETLRDKIAYIPQETFLFSGSIFENLTLGLDDATMGDIIEASKAVYDKYGCPVLSKGGHFTDTACVCDYLWDGKQIITFETKRVDNPNSHGTGCTLSSAIASGLAKGQPLEQAVDNGKRYVTACLKAMLDLGHGSGPMNHGALITQ